MALDELCAYVVDAHAALPRFKIPPRTRKIINAFQVWRCFVYCATPRAQAARTELSEESLITVVFPRTQSPKVSMMI